MSYPRDLLASMEEIRKAMSDHRRAREEAMARQTERRRKDSSVAYAVARPHWERMLRAWRKLEAQLPEWTPHLDNRLIDAWLDVCAVDVPAYRIGYMKERIYRGLKKVALSEAQRQRVLALALHHLKAHQWRRELRELSRLAVPLADAAFLRELETLWRSELADIDRYKVGLTLDQLLLQRKDLQALSAILRSDVMSALHELRRRHWEALHPRKSW